MVLLEEKLLQDNLAHFPLGLGCCHSTESHRRKSATTGTRNLSLLVRELKRLTPSFHSTHDL